MEETIQQLERQNERAAAVFSEASPVQDVGRKATGIALQLPVFVQNETAKPLVAGDPNAQPPFYDLPGYAYSYEIDFEGGLAYLYLAAVPADQQSADELAQQVQGAIAKKFSGAVWQDVTLETFDGGSITLKKLSADGPQLFGGNREDGRFDLYLVSSANYHVLIGWRAIAGASAFFDKVAISMGTVTGAT